MLESVLSGVLNRLVSAYVEDFDTSQLNVGIWSGDVKLRNLQIKKTALDQLGLPIELVEGEIGELVLKIPWSRLGRAPVRIMIDGVSLLTAPAAARVDQDALAARAVNAKLERLNNLELVMQSKAENSGAGVSEDQQRQSSFVASLITNIVDNVQVEIKNIHARYEDRASMPGHPFAAGVTLSKLSLESTDESWVPAFVSSAAAESIHKLAQMDALAVYFDTDFVSDQVTLTDIDTGESSAEPNSNSADSTSDAAPEDNEDTFLEANEDAHQFILKPVTALGKFTLAKKKDTREPRIRGHLSFDQLAFVLDAFQYRDTLSMIDLFHFYSRRVTYMKYYPSQRDLDENRPRALLQFAIRAVLGHIHDKREQNRWEHIAKRRDTRKRFIDLFVKRLCLGSGVAGPSPMPLPASEPSSTSASASTPQEYTMTPAEVAEMNKLESDLDIHDIRLYRSMAREMYRTTYAESIEKQNQMRQAQRDQQQQTSTWAGWAASWVYSSPSPAENTTVLSEDDKKKIYQAIEWDEQSAIAGDDDDPPETILLQLKTSLNAGSFTLRRRPDDSADLMSFNVSQLDLNYTQRPANFESELLLGSLGVIDGSVQNSFYKNIVQVKKPPASSSDASSLFSRMLPSPSESEPRSMLKLGGFSGKSSPSTALSSAHSVSSPLPPQQVFFYLKFENNPLDKRADSALNVRLLPTEIVYNRQYIEELVSFLRPPASQLESVNAMLNVASSQLEGLRRETNAGLSYVLQTHKTVDIALDLTAPIVIIPESLNTPASSTHLVLDAGRIQVQSQLADKNHLHDIANLPRDRLYDHYAVQLHDTQLLVASSLDSARHALAQKSHSAAHTGSELHILERTSLAFLAKSCVLPDLPDTPRFVFEGNLPALQLNVSDGKYKALMTALDLATPRLGDPQGSVPPSVPAGPAPSVNGTDDSSSRSLLNDSDEPDQEPSSANNILFQFSLRVHHVQASVFRTMRDHERLLANTVFEGFSLDFINSDTANVTDISLHSLYIQDMMVSSQRTGVDSEFMNLVWTGDTHADDNNFISVHVEQAKTDAKDFDISTSVELQTLTVSVTRASILTLFDWVMVTFAPAETPSASVSPGVSPGVSPSVSPGASPNGVASPPSQTASPHGVASPPPQTASPHGTSPAAQEPPKHLKVNVTFTSLVAILNDDGLRLATLSVSRADIALNLFAQISLAAHVGEISMQEDLSGSHVLSVVDSGDHSDFFQVTYDTFDEATATQKNCDSFAYVRSQMLQITVVHAPLERIILFFSKFARMQALYDAARKAASDRATEVQSELAARKRLKYDIVAHAPTIIAPYSASQRVLATLGQISVRNAFDGDLATVSASLQNVYMASSFEGQELGILDDLHLNVELCMLPEAMQVHASLSDVNLKVTRAQYIFVLRFIKSVLSMGKDVADQGNAPTAHADREDSASASIGTTQAPISASPGASADVYRKSSPVEEAAAPQRAPLTATFTSGKITCELFSTPPTYTRIDDVANTSMIRTALDGLGARFHASGPDQQLDASLHAISISDTMTKSKFRKILGGAGPTDADMITLRFAAREKSSLAEASVNTPRVVFSLGPLLAVSDFVTVPDDEEDTSLSDTSSGDEPSEESHAQDDHHPNAALPPPKPLVLSVDIQKPSLVLLEDREKSDSAACTISIGRIKLHRHRVLDLDVDQIAMHLSRMNRPESMQILDEINLAMMLDTKRGCVAQLAVDQCIIFRAAAQDLLLLSAILQRSSQLISERGASQDPRDPKKAHKPKPPAQHLQPPAGMQPPSQDERHPQEERLSASFAGVELILISDVLDLPVLSYQTSHFVAHARDWSSGLAAGVSFQPSISYFNLVMSAWEPVFDPWDFSVDVSRVPLDTLPTAKAAVEEESLPRPGAQSSEGPPVPSRPQPRGTSGASGPSGAPPVPPRRALGSSEEPPVPSRPGTDPLVLSRTETAPPVPSRPDANSLDLSRTETAPPVPSRAGTAPPVPSRAGTAPPVPSRGGTAPPVPSRAGTAPPVPSRTGTAPVVPSKPDKSSHQLTPNSPLLVKVMASKRLEITVAWTLLSQIRSGLFYDSRTQSGTYLQTRGQTAPFKIVNQTGYAIALWSETSGRAGEPGEGVLAAGHSMPWRFHDVMRLYKKRGTLSRSILSVSFPEREEWTALSHIPIDREGERVYMIRVAGAEHTTHRLLVEVRLHNNIKVVTFRSPYQVVNHTFVPLEMVVVDTEGRTLSGVEQLPPGSRRAVPIEAAYKYLVRVRPLEGFGYRWSSEGLHWRDLVRRPTRTIECRSSQEASSFRLRVHSVTTALDVVNGSSNATTVSEDDGLTSSHVQRRKTLPLPQMSVHLWPPFEIENLLPYDFRFRIFDKNKNRNWSSFLRRGGTAPLHVANLSHLIVLSVELQDSPFNRSDFAIINTDNPEDLPIENELQMTDADGRVVNLCLNYSVYKNSGGAFKLQVYSPYVIINKTGLHFNLKTNSFFSSMTTGRPGQQAQAQAQARQDPSAQSRVQQSETMIPYDNAQESLPFLFSFPKNTTKNRVFLQAGKSTWSSKPLSLDAIGIEMATTLPSQNLTSELHVGILVDDGIGDYKLSKVVTLYPRYNIINNLDRPLLIRAADRGSSVAIPPKENHPLLEFLPSNVPPMLQFSADSNHWSPFISLLDVGRSFIRTGVESQSVPELLKIFSTVDQACVNVSVSRSESYPLRIENKANVPITLYQAPPMDTAKLQSQLANYDKGYAVTNDVAVDPIAHVIVPAPRMATKVYHVAHNETLNYTWDDHIQHNKKLVFRVGSACRLIDIMELGPQEPLRFKLPRDSTTRALSVEIDPDGDSHVLRISDYNETRSVFKATRSSSEFQLVSEKSVTTRSLIAVDLEGIGISLLDRNRNELLYMTMLGVQFAYKDSSASSAIDLAISWIQIDNQLYNTAFPILLYPSVVGVRHLNNALRGSRSTLQVQLVIAKNDEGTDQVSAAIVSQLLCVKYASILLQEISIEVDESFLVAMLDFVDFDTPANADVDFVGIDAVSSSSANALTEQPPGLPKQKPDVREGDMYIQLLHLQPVQVDLSFMRTGEINAEQRLDTRTALAFFVNALTMAIGNVSDAPVRLNALALENVRVSSKVLMDRLRLHYSQEVLGQVYRVIGSADFLGNPVGLFTNISSAFSDFFVKPEDSEMLDPEKDLDPGLARNATSLAKRTVFELSDSMSKVTGSISKGLSAATLDDQFQFQRRRQTRNRPKHAWYGISSGASLFAASVASGFEGLATKPLEGAETYGASGFFSGMGRGLVGAVTKPVVGIFDFASNISEGIRNSADVGAITTIDRIRYPRIPSMDGFVHPYNERQARGCYWLKTLDGGAFSDLTYVCHLDLETRPEASAVILSTTKLIFVRVVNKDTIQLVWQLDIGDLEVASLDARGIRLLLQNGKPGPYITVADEASKLWFFRHFSRTVDAFNKKV